MYPSSGEINVSMRHLVFVTLCGRLSGMQGAYQTVITQSDKYQVSHRYIYFSWWWVHSRPKHERKEIHILKKLCTKLALFTRLCKDARSTKH